MNFSIYLDDETGRQLNLVAEQTGKSRNALVRQAVSDWLIRHGKPRRPDEVLAFKAMADMLPFEASRDRLRAPVADPLARGICAIRGRFGNSELGLWTLLQEPS